MAEMSKQGLSQYLETGRQKSAIAKFWGVLYFKGDSDYICNHKHVFTYWNKV